MFERRFSVFSNCILIVESNARIEQLSWPILTSYIDVFGDFQARGGWGHGEGVLDDCKPNWASAEEVDVKTAKDRER